MHREEVDLLKKRSSRMLVHASRCLKSGDYDLAAFLAEQAVQIHLKATILELTGEVPRTHIIRQILSLLKSLYADKRASKIEEFTRKHRRLLIGLEEAYLASRYLYRPYELEEAKELVKFAEKVIRFVENLKSKA